MRWILRLAVLGTVVGIVAFVARWINGAAFDPAQPRHDWGTTSLTIDDDRS